MALLAEIHRSVAAEIERGRIGEPVFARVEIQAGEGASLEPVAIAATTAAAAWIGRSPKTIYAVATSERDAVRLALVFANGASGVVGVSRAGSEPPRLDVMMVGNHGTIYYQSCCEVDAPAGREAWLLEEVKPPWSASVRQAVQQALARGEPVPVPDGKP